MGFEEPSGGWSRGRWESGGCGQRWAKGAGQGWLGKWRKCLGRGQVESGEARKSELEASEAWEGPPLLHSSPSQTWTGDWTIYLHRNKNLQTMNSRPVQGLTSEHNCTGALGVPV